MYPFLYKVEILPLDTETQQGTNIQAGIVYATDYAGAVHALTDYYDEDDIVEILSLFAMEDSPIIITGEAYDAIKKGDWDVDTYVQ